MATSQIVYNKTTKRIAVSMYARRKGQDIIELVYNRKALEKKYGKLGLVNGRYQNPLGFFYGEICSKDKYWYKAPWGIFTPIANTDNYSAIREMVEKTKQLMAEGIVEPFNKEKHGLNKKSLPWIIKSNIRHTIRKVSRGLDKFADAV